MRYKLIVFEGVDGSGKTVLAKELAKQVNGAYHYSPPKIIQPFRRIADNSSNKLRYYFYSFGNYIDCLEVKRLLKKKHVVCDWYFYATIAYHSALLDRKLKLPNLLEPDFIIYTTAPWDEIEKRLSSRHKTEKYSDVSFLKKVSKNYDDMFNRKDNVIKINTSRKDIANVIKHLRMKMNL